MAMPTTNGSASNSNAPPNQESPHE
jgi:hypothetical protein